jgi:4'-phosphopantetheinyl transferase
MIEDMPGLGTDDCQVWWASLADCADWHAKLLDQAERRRRERYLRAADRDRFTVGVALTRLILAGLLGIAAADVPVDRTCARCGEPHGRPRLAIGAALDFSVSHSGDLIALAVTRDKAGDGMRRAVGVDVEQIAHVPDGPPADAVLSPRERIAFDRLEAGTRTTAFFRYWVRKEALLKATGDGLAVAMTRLTVSAPDQPPRLVHWQGRPDLPAGASLHDLQARPGYAAALALVGHDAVVVCRDATELMTVPSSLPA